MTENSSSSSRPLYNNDYDYSIPSTEHRHRTSPSHRLDADVNDVEAPGQDVLLTTTDTSCDDDLDDLDQKYDKRAKARIQRQQQRRRRRKKQQMSGSKTIHWGSHFHAHAHHGPSKPPTNAQRAGLLLLFTVLLAMWHYMRTVWWTHGRLAARHHKQILDMQHQKMIHQQHSAHHYNGLLHPRHRHAATPEQHHHQQRQQQNRMHRREQREQQQQQQQQVHVPQAPLQHHIVPPLAAPEEKSSIDKSRRTSSDELSSSAEEQRQRGRAKYGQQQQPSSSKEDESSSRSSDSKQQQKQQQQQQQTPKQQLQQQQPQKKKKPKGDGVKDNGNFHLVNLSTARLQDLFLEQLHRTSTKAKHRKIILTGILQAWLDKINFDIVQNAHGGIRWVRPNLLPPLRLSDSPPKKARAKIENHEKDEKEKEEHHDPVEDRDFFHAQRIISSPALAWQEEWTNMTAKLGDSSTETARALTQLLHQPVVDYTSSDKYQYPQPLEFKTALGGSEYPKWTNLQSIVGHWDPDDDFHGTITETLMHFNFTDPDEMKMARKFRDAELPFKLYNVPELAAANKKWMDEYVAKQFDAIPKTVAQQRQKAKGHAYESPNNFFCHYSREKWNPYTMGLPPTRISDWSFETWSQHAQYADAVQLRSDQPHFSWEAGVSAVERNGPKQDWSFISRDLPSWSSTTQNFISFEPESSQKKSSSIQCRFGERGVVAATHYDAGRNMVGMITGAKRYILSPPTACNKLGVFSSRKSPLYRHSLLNFGHFKYLNDTSPSNENDEGVGSMSPEEHAWLERASQAQAVETVVKAGEVLYVPSFYFSYVISLQKSAQCNVRSGIGGEGTSKFGGQYVMEGRC